LEAEEEFIQDKAIVHEEEDLMREKMTISEELDDLIQKRSAVPDDCDEFFSVDATILLQFFHYLFMKITYLTN
jgi:hypothetical protein